MNDDPRGFQISSARRGGGSGLWIIAAVVVLLLAVVLAVLREGDELPPTPPTPEPIPNATEIPTAAPVATVLVEESSTWVTVDGPTPTPSPWPTALPTLARPTRPQPSPTPLLSECVFFRWTARQVFLPSAQVMIEIDLTNRCNRDLGQMDLWFDITGWRDGQWIQNVRGHPFEDIGRGRGGNVTIGLPGSIDWYDEISVEILD